jgi:hypothetical protein
VVVVVVLLVVMELLQPRQADLVVELPLLAQTAQPIQVEQALVDKDLLEAVLRKTTQAVLQVTVVLVAAEQTTRLILLFHNQVCQAMVVTDCHFQSAATLWSTLAVAVVLVLPTQEPVAQAVAVRQAQHNHAQWAVPMAT